MSTLITETLARLVPLLPRYPEEGGEASSILRDEIAERLKAASDTAPPSVIQSGLEWIETLFIRCGLLDLEALQAGRWRFVSHPAQLCALSLLNTLADPRQKLFPAGFWQTAGVGDKEKEAQKRVLSALEDRRQAHHLDAGATPIRFIYVAWGLIKLDGKLLFHEREAREHRHEYGLVGGRVNLRDLRQVLGEQLPLPDVLAALQAPDSDPMFEAMSYALSREFEEETGLIQGEHFAAEPWRNLEPWQACMGGAPNYALTRYFFRLYHIRLTTPGFLALRRSLDRQYYRLLACDIDEVVTGGTRDGGKTFTIKAIYDDFKNDREALKAALLALPESYDHPYRYTDDTDALILSEKDILRGDAGKEKPLQIPLTPEQKALLMGFAAHGKGLTITTPPDAGLKLHDYGWVEIHDPGLLEAVTELSESFRQADVPLIEMSDRRYARLSLPANLLFFDPGFFTYTLSRAEGAGKLTFCLRRLPIPTRFGLALAGEFSHPCAPRLAEQLQTLASGRKILSLDEQYESWPGNIRKTLQSLYHALGLRNLLITRENHYHLASDSSNPALPTS
jgi:8-oxo-dGTP pyrophosphatase MutT (NUDIX family)